MSIKGPLPVHVLVIDSNPAARQRLGAQCSALGWNVDLADSGGAALECMDYRVQAGRTPYLAVFMDWHLPGLGRSTLARQIRLVDPHTALIAMIDNSEPHCLQTDAASDCGGPVTFLTKPPTTAALEAVVTSTPPPETKALADPYTGSRPILRHDGMKPDSDTVEAILTPITQALMQDANRPPQKSHGPEGEVVDVAGAMALLEDNVELYAQITRSFLDDISTLSQRLEPSLSAQDLSEATRTLHTAKGLSLTMGATQLATVCRRAEQTLKTVISANAAMDPKALNSICDELRTSVAATTRALEAALNSMHGSVGAGSGLQPPDGALDIQGLVGELQILQALLRQSDMQAVDAHRQMCQTYGQAAAGRLDALNCAMQAFDFERGVVQCGVLLREFGIHNQND